jgi:hypothetical protein
VLTRGNPEVHAILLVESGSRHLLERLVPVLRENWNYDIFIDLVTCYTTLPEGFLPDTSRLYCVAEYRGRELRRQLYHQLDQNRYSLVGIVCSAEPLMTKWKWALAWRTPAKLFIINENGDFFWFDRHHWSQVWRFVLYRSGLAGEGAVRTLARLASFPFTLLYLLLYATAVHARRAFRRTGGNARVSGAD